jgi:hypothetical protein
MLPVAYSKSKKAPINAIKKAKTRLADIPLIVAVKLLTSLRPYTIESIIIRKPLRSAIYEKLLKKLISNFRPKIIAKSPKLRSRCERVVANLTLGIFAPAKTGNICVKEPNIIKEKTPIVKA